MESDHLESRFHCRKGQELAMLGSHNAALLEFDRALAADPDSSEAFHYKGLTLHYMGCYDEALDLFNKALALDPLNRDIAFHTARTRRSLGLIARPHLEELDGGRFTNWRLQWKHRLAQYYLPERIRRRAVKR